MNRLFERVSLASIIVVGTMLAPQAVLAYKKIPPGQSLLIMNKPHTDVEKFRERLKKRGLTIINEVRCKTDAFSVFEVQPRSGSVKTALAGVQTSGDVDLEGAEVKFKSEFQQCVPSINDSDYANQWYLQSLKYSEMRCVLDAFSKTQVIKPRITMIDTGIDPYAGELVDIQQYNFFGGANGTASEAPFDPGFNGLKHGTATSSIAASTTNNGIHLASPGSHDKAVSITMCRVTDGNTLDTLDVIRAMTWCVDNQVTRGGPSAINMSVNAAPPATYNSSSVVQGIAKSAAKQGDLFVNGAGNTNDLDPSKPNKNFRVVMGIDENDMRWVNTSLNPVRGSVFGKFKAACPASNILFLVPPNSTGTNSGTSLSGPIWAGSIAMLMSFDPSLTAPKADKLLLKTGTKTPDKWVKPNLNLAVIKALKLKP